MKNKPSQQQNKKRIRRFTSWILGSLAATLVILGIVSLWLNNTLTDTDNYVETVAPLSRNLEVQNFVADMIASSIYQDADTSVLAQTLLSKEQLRSNNKTEQNEHVEDIIRQEIFGYMRSDIFEKRWVDANRSIHNDLTTQLQNDDNRLVLDFGPIIAGVREDLTSTRLKSVLIASNSSSASSENAGIVQVNNQSVGRIKQGYSMINTVVWVFIAIILIVILLAEMFSTNRLNTAKRILLSSGITAVVFGLLIRFANLIPISGASADSEQRVIIAILSVLLKSLSVILISYGVAALLASLAYYMYAHFNANIESRLKKQS
jgi:hypothetical protein